MHVSRFLAVKRTCIFSLNSCRSLLSIQHRPPKKHSKDVQKNVLGMSLECSLQNVLRIKWCATHGNFLITSPLFPYQAVNIFVIVADLFASPRFRKRARRGARGAKSGVYPVTVYYRLSRLSKAKGWRPRDGIERTMPRYIDRGPSRCARRQHHRGCPGRRFGLPHAIGECADPRAADGAP